MYIFKIIPIKILDDVFVAEIEKFMLNSYRLS